MSRRTKAREIVLQMLYQNDLNPDVDGESVRAMIAEQLHDPGLEEFAWKLYAGVLEFRGLLDRKIESVAQHWVLSRMAATDRNVLRLGAFELLQTDAPHRVVIDEALELAKKFGSAQSAPFVNGVLDKLVPAQKRARPRPSGPESDSGAASGGDAPSIGTKASDN